MNSALPSPVWNGLQKLIQLSIFGKYKNSLYLEIIKFSQITWQWIEYKGIERLRFEIIDKYESLLIYKQKYFKLRY